MSMKLSPEGFQLLAEAISSGRKLEFHPDGHVERILCSTCCTESAGRTRFLAFAEDGMYDLGVITVCLNPECADGEKR